MRTLAIIVLAVAPFTRGHAAVESADVVVYGGTSAGVTAVLAAARAGRSVILVEPGQHVGGMSVEGLGGSDIDNHNFRNSPAVGGIALEFYRRVADAYGRRERFDKSLETGGKNTGLWRFEPHVAERVFAEMLEHPKITVWRGCRIVETDGVSVDADTKRITEFRCENGSAFRGRVFIDATYEGDLLHFAGVTTFIGREPADRYGEPKNGIQDRNTYRQFSVRVDPYIVPGDPSSGVIPTIQDEPLGEPGAGDHRIQAYCFRMCLTSNASNRIPFTKPAGYDPNQYEIYVRYIAAGGKLWTPRSSIPGGKTDLGSWHDLSANLYGMNHEYPGGDYATRERVLREHLTFTQGLCWFLSNDPRVPESLRSKWSAWGVCKDEFTDNGGWPRMFYVREARRMVSDYVITQHHTAKTNQTPVEDPVAVAYWPPDTHHVRRIVRDGAAYNEGFVFGGDDWAPFGIAYRSLVPRGSECTNVLTPTCMSSTHVAYGAIRLEWTFMAVGHATGEAAAMAVERDAPVQTVEYAELARRLDAADQVRRLSTAE